MVNKGSITSAKIQHVSLITVIMLDSQCVSFKLIGRCVRWFQAKRYQMGINQKQWFQLEIHHWFSTKITNLTKITFYILHLSSKLLLFSWKCPWKWRESPWVFQLSVNISIQQLPVCVIRLQSQNLHETFFLTVCSATMKHHVHLWLNVIWKNRSLWNEWEIKEDLIKSPSKPSLSIMSTSIKYGYANKICILPEVPSV